jgi:uncharacterized membrane protein
MNWYRFFFVHKRLISAVKRVEFASVMMSCVILRGRWCDIIALNVQAPTENNLIIRRAATTRNWNVYSINSLNTMRKFC